MRWTYPVSVSKLLNKYSSKITTMVIWEGKNRAMDHAGLHISSSFFRKSVKVMQDNSSNSWTTAISDHKWAFWSPSWQRIGAVRNCSHTLMVPLAKAMPWLVAYCFNCPMYFYTTSLSMSTVTTATRFQVTTHASHITARLNSVEL